MKFMLMMHTPREKGREYGVAKWTPADWRAHHQHMRRLNEELRAAGEFVAGYGLAPPSQARLVRTGKGDAPEVTDGPFPEAKEFLAGWWIVDVESAERAYVLAARVSAAPGPGGQPLRMALEVREVPAGPPVDA